MARRNVKIVIISGSPRKASNTTLVMKFVNEYTKTKDHTVKFINLSEDGVDYFRGDGRHNQTTEQAARDITDADVWLVGSPIYNSFFSSALKNLFEYINYKETAGKVAGLAIVAAGNIGFTCVQTLLTQLMSYFRVTTNPKAVYITTNLIKDGGVGDGAQNRLKEMVDETLEMALKLRPAKG